jgi:hypothetical protein
LAAFIGIILGRRVATPEATACFTHASIGQHWNERKPENVHVPANE